jgi:hypothetical protein
MAAWETVEKNTSGGEGYPNSGTRPFGGGMGRYLVEIFLKVR